MWDGKEDLEGTGEDKRILLKSILQRSLEGMDRIGL